MNKKNKLMLVIIILTIIIILISIVLYILINKSLVIESDENENIQLEQMDNYIADKDIKKLTNRNKYFAINRIINSYFSYAEKINGEIHLSYEVTEEERKQIQKEEQEDAIKAIKQMCKDYYSDKNNNFIIKDMQIYNDNNFKIEDMYISEIDSKINIFFVELKSEDLENTIVVKTDSDNMTFNIYPGSFVQQYKNNKEEILNIINDDVQIEKNNYNVYKYVNITDEYIARLYFNDYINNISSNTKLAYTLLEDEYATKRFKNYEDFYNYAQIIANEKVQIKEYMVNKDKGYNEYVCKDQYENLYIFKEEAIMEYTVTLDTYTLPQEKFNTEYAKATNINKVKMNIDKFFQMLNAKDYKTSYNLLDSNFKNNNFQTEENFKKYMQSKLYLYNDVSYINFSNEISGVYTYYIEISNREKKEDKKIKMNIVMQLLEGTNYKLSFSIID